MLSPNRQELKPSYLDDLRGVLTPNSGGNRSLTKLSLKYRDQKLSLTPLADCLSVRKHFDKSVGKENVSFIGKAADLKNANTSAATRALKPGEMPNYCATMEEPNRWDATNNCDANSNSCIARVLDYSVQESPGLLDKAVTTILWSDSESEDNQILRNGTSVIVISDSDEPSDVDEKISELSRLVSTTSVDSESKEVSSESRDVAFLLTPSSGISPLSKKFSVSTASATSSRKLQLLRNIISSSEEDDGSSPLPLVKRISQPQVTKPNVPHSPQTSWALREPRPAVCSSDDDDNDEVFEQFLEKCKTPLQAPRICLEDRLNTFIVSDSDKSSDSGDDLVYLVRTDLPGNRTTKPATKTRNPGNEFAKPHPVRVRSSADTPERPKFKQPPQIENLTRSLPHLPHRPTAAQSTGARFSFVVSLSTNIDPLMRDSRAAVFIKDYKKLKADLVTELYSMFNERIFENKLPKDMLIAWNPRLTATAGYCYTKKELSGVRTARLELSTKVLDSTERLRDTLVHELCHAATWLINGIRDGHGRYWKAWARLAPIKFPGLPPVSRCHSYHVQTKYTYQCTVCSYRIGRHSKSLDINKKVCGRCHGKFEILVNNTPSKSPKTPNKFALFVKDNYGQVKKNRNLKAHADVMRSLSEEFAAKNNIA